MADKVRKVDYFKMFVPDRPGEGARVLGALRELGVNLLAFTGFPRGRRIQLDFFPEDPALFRRAARKAGFRLAGKKTGFLVQGADRMGAVAGILEKLAGAGVSVTALDALGAGKKRFGAVVWVKQADLARAARAIRAA